MNTHLKTVTHNYSYPAKMYQEVERVCADLRARTSEELQYACQHWIAHLSLLSGGTASALDMTDLTVALDLFCTTNLFFWLEVVTLLGILDASLSNYHNMYAFVKVCLCTYSCLPCLIK